MRSAESRASSYLGVENEVDRNGWIFPRYINTIDTFVYLSNKLERVECLTVGFFVVFF